jgi:hypothetical protein
MVKRYPHASEQGGTKIFFPFCKKFEVCKAVPLTYLDGNTGQRLYRADHSDIQWFRRSRVCLTCSNQFITAEIDEDFLDELVQLRDALGDIKMNASNYIQQANKALATLSKLADSLDVLMALDLYKQGDDET